MRTLGRRVRLAVYLALVTAGLALQAAPVSAQAPGEAFLIHVDGVIDPNRAKYLDRALDRATAEQGQLAIVLIDTPGGRLDSMRAMVEDILDAGIPVVTYVAPQGARAGSAGTFITGAGHIAVMAPGSNIGAATPISGTGEDLPETLADKVTNDAAALARSIAEARGRNPNAYESTVREASSYTAVEALDLNMIDFLADDLNDLLAKIDGRTVEAGGRTVTLQTDGIRCTEPFAACNDVGLSWVERIIDVIADPNISSLLLSLGGLGIFIEILNPGLIFPGVFGAIALVLAFVAFGNIPVNWAGVGLVLFSLVLLYVELQIAGVGIFGAGAVIAFVFGVIFLLEPWAADPPSFAGPDFNPSPWLVGGLAGGFGGAFTLLTWLGLRGSATGAERPAVVGKTGRVRRDLTPTGSVFVDGQLWTAEEINGAFVPAGEFVEVEGLDGLTLWVKKRVRLLPEGGRHGLPEGGEGPAPERPAH